MSNFTKLNGVNVEDKIKKKKDLNYLSWAYAWGEVKKEFPTATYEIIKFNGLPYVFDPNTGYMVYTTVTIEELTHEMWLPVLDYKNKALINATMFDINKALMRCLTKNIAMHGLGLYIYAGEDLPAETDTDKATQEQLDTIKKLVDVAKLCAYYKIDTLEEMSYAQAEDVIAKKTGGTK